MEAIKPVIEQIADQLADKCIHFTGLQNTTCKKDVVYKDVRTQGSPPRAIPCFKRHNLNTCSQCEFRTPEQVQKEAKEINDRNNKFMGVMMKCKTYFKENKGTEGQVACGCGDGGTIVYSVAYNGHMRGSCDTCEIGFIE